MNYYCDIWYWRASDQEEVARYLLRDRPRTTGEPETPRRAGLVRSALLSVLRTAGLWWSSRSRRARSSRRRPRHGRAVTVVVRSSSTGRPCSMTASGFSDAPSAGTWIACSGSRRSPELSCWGSHGGDGECK